MKQTFDIINQSEKTIRSLYLQAMVLDDTGDEITTIQCVFQGENVEPGKTFSSDKAFTVGSDLAYKVEVICEKASFTDDSVWRAEDGAQAYEVELSDIKDFPRRLYLAREYNKILEERGVVQRDKRGRYIKMWRPEYLPIKNESNGYWTCTCGMPVKINKSCPVCKCSYEELQKIFSQDHLAKIQHDAVLQRAADRALETAGYREKLDKAIEEKKAAEYEKALSSRELKSIPQLTIAVGLLDGLGDYKDAKKIAAEYRSRLEELKAEEEKKRQEEEKKAAAIAEERAKQAAKEAEILRQQTEKRKKHIIFASVATIAFIAICAATIKIIIPNNKYNAAVTLMDNGDYDAAIKAFEAMADYKDSAERIKECKYCAAVAMMGNGDYEEAKKEFKAIGDYKDSAEQIEECRYNIAISSMNSGNFIGAYQDFENIIDYKDSAELQASIRTEYEIALISKAEVGDIVHFGMYEQDNIDSNGSEPIDWVVLEKSQNKTLLISNYVLDCYPFNKEQKEVTWEKSDVREWLNSTFYESAFSKEEQSFIQITHVKADDNPHYGTSAGNSTEDKLFYLSVPEVIKYSSDNGKKRIAFATPYAIAEGVEAMENGYAPWGLRTPGSKQFAITAIARNSGAICGIGNTTAAGEGFYVDATGQGVRPAMWIDGN